MPGSHFSSKRLRKALQTKADTRMAGTVPRIGRPLASMRLLPRVEKDCNCRVPKPKPPAFITKVGRLQNNNQIVDPDDMFGSNGTTWIQSSGIKVGDTVSFISTQTNQLFTSTVDTIGTNAQDDAYLLILKDNHGQNVGVNVDVNLYI